MMGIGLLKQHAIHFNPGPVLTFLLFLIVTRETPGTGFMPSFCIAFLLFFSDRLCLPRPPGPPPSSTRLKQLQLHALHVTQADLQLMFTSFVIIQVRGVIFAVNVRLIVVFDLLQTVGRRALSCRDLAAASACAQVVTVRRNMRTSTTSFSTSALVIVRFYGWDI